MAIKFTPDQEKAIHAKGTVLVAAAAGSGKTAVLTKRVIERVCDPTDSTSIDRLLIVTFTNASALEMRLRIAQALDEVAAENINNSYILRQKLLVKSAKICTIDSFCIELVRKHFGSLGVSPDFRIADEAEESKLKDLAWQKIITPYYSDKTEAFNSLTEIFNVFKGDNALKDAVMNIYDFSLCLSRKEQWLKDAENNYLSDTLSENPFGKVILQNADLKLNGIIDSYNLILRESVGTELEYDWQQSFGDKIDYINEIRSNISNSQWDTAYSMLCEFKVPTVSKKKKGQNDELHKRMMEIRERSKKIVLSIVGDMGGTESEVLSLLKKTSFPLRTLLKIVREFSEEYFNLLNCNNLLTFAIVEQLALKLLCVDTENGLMPSDIAKEISGLYDEILVDEYQDNNDLQDALFYALSDSGKHLFMVGDVKQCIYAFRNAEPDNFLKRKNDYPLYDGVNSPSKIILSSNFRSRKGVCDFVNGVFTSIMQEKTCGLDYTDEEKLVAGAQFPENNTLCADVCLNENTDGNRDISDAESVADYIVSVMREDAFLSDGGDLRKAEYGDFAILLRSPNSKVKYYTDALKKRGIPVSYNTNEFFLSPEILTVISILKVIDNPTADIPLLSVMTSVAFGFSFDEVVDINTENFGKNMYQKVINAANNGNEKCSALLKILTELRTSAITTGVDRLILEIYRTTYLKEIMSSADNGFERKNNLSALVYFAADYESKGNGSLGGFLTYFDRLSEKGKLPEKTPNISNNSVRIMSFHGSKGLQFPICIIAGCGNGFNKQDLNQPMIINGKLGVGLNYIDNGVKCDTLSRRALRCAQQFKLISEEIRLLYVAMTRAEERLMISVTADNCVEDVEKASNMITLQSLSDGKVSAEQILSATGYKHFLLAALLLQKDGHKISNIADINLFDNIHNGEFRFTFSRRNDTSDKAITKILNKNQDSCSISEETRAFLNERFDYKYPFKDETELPSKMAVTELVHGDRDSFAFKLRPRFMSKAGLTPAERGTALHKIMQYADYSKACDDLETELLRLYEYEFITEEEYNSIDLNYIKGFFNSSVFNRIQNAEKVLREYKFMVYQPIAKGKTIVQGIADCIFFEDGKAVILDFKTDNVSEMNVLAERYSKQLDIYKSAISEIFDTEVKECIIYSIHLNKYIDV